MNKIYNLVRNKIYYINTQEDSNEYTYDKEGYDKEGFNGEGYDREGFNREGYDKSGYDRERFNREGYDRAGIIKKEYDKYKRQKKQGEGLKIITLKQMLSRLPVLLAQIHAGNNSLKLKNEIRRLLYSLYRSKMISKTVYNNLIATM